MDLWHILKFALGVLAISMAFFVKQFSPAGWTTHLLWGSGKDAQIPRWLAASFYLAVGLILLYRGIYK